MTGWCRIAVVVSLLLGGAAGTPALAQTRATSGDLVVTARDDSGAALAGATVSLVHDETGLVRTGTTNAAGRLTAPALPLGRYSVRVELASYQPSVVDAVAVSLGTIAELTIALHVAAADATVEVVGAATLVDVRGTAVAAVVGERQIADLAIDRRDYISFALLAPGVASDRTPSQGPAQTSGLTFAGQSPRANNLTVDGVDNNDESVGGVRAVFSDACGWIRERRRRGRARSGSRRARRASSAIA